jgi:hypothetical protein
MGAHLRLQMLREQYLSRFAPTSGPMRQIIVRHCVPVILAKHSRGAFVLGHGPNPGQR